MKKLGDLKTSPKVRARFMLGAIYCVANPSHSLVDCKILIQTLYPIR